MGGVIVGIIIIFGGMVLIGLLPKRYILIGITVVYLGAWFTYETTLHFAMQNETINTKQGTTEKAIINQTLEMQQLKNQIESMQRSLNWIESALNIKENREKFE